MDKLPRWRRRQTLVNLDHQLRFTSVLLVQMTAVMAVIGAFAWLESRSMLGLVLRHLGDFPATSSELHVNNQAFLFKIILAIAFTGFFQVMFGLYTSHKLAGPIHKMTGVLERARHNDFSQRINFRDEDRLEELAEALNLAMARLASEQASARGKVLEIEQALSALRVDGPSGCDEAQLERMRERLSDLAQVEHHALESVGC